ncbi:MAG: cell division protein FtsX [Candidatus Cryptobacteroides sp.]
MAKGENRLIKRRLVNSYLSTIMSISLVLLLVGLASLLLVNARSVSDYFKENMQVSVLLKQEIGNKDAIAFQSVLDTKNYVHRSKFISKEQGTQELSELLGSDFLKVFKSSPVPASIELKLKADYVSQDSLAIVKKEVSAYPQVEEVVYQQSLVDALNSNLTKISLVLGVFILLLLFISFVLINNTVRLNVYSRRFTIHTMKLVGATRAFIRMPFLVQSIFQGLFSAMIAILLLLGILFFVRNEFEQLFEIFKLDLLLLVIGIVVASGLVICVLSTYFAVNKLVSLSKDELYY